MANKAKKAGIVAAASGAGAIGAAGVADKLNPIKYAITADPAWHMNNADGTMSHAANAVQVLNESGNHAAMTAAAIIGAIGAGATAHHLLRKHQFDK